MRLAKHVAARVAAPIFVAFACAAQAKIRRELEEYGKIIRALGLKA